jgi:DNA protecting protein DprA
MSFDTYNSVQRFEIHYSELPQALQIVPEPPERLWIESKVCPWSLLSALPERGLGIVGTRTPTLRSLHFLEETLLRLSQDQNSRINKESNASLILVSGFARGVDAAAHSGAIRNGIPTLAILGMGLDIRYPVENDSLRAQILDHHGVILSEFPPSQRALKHQFLRRNRLIAAWSKALWVVEAGIPSGALNTAAWGRQMDRAIYSTPSFPGDPSFAGNQQLMDRDHAQPFWGVHSLGSAWLNLAARPAASTSKSGRRSGKGKTEKPMEALETLLLERVQNGGCSLNELLEAFLDQGAAASEFFDAYVKLLEQGTMIENEGWLQWRSPLV